MHKYLNKVLTWMTLSKCIFVYLDFNFLDFPENFRILYILVCFEYFKHINLLPVYHSHRNWGTGSTCPPDFAIKKEVHFSFQEVPFSMMKECP